MINDLSKYEPITSYQNLNDKYDLNFTDYNLGFDWEVFKHLATDVWAPFFTTTCYYRIEPTARNTFKTTVHLWFAVFMALNFTDSSSKILRRYANSHIATTFGHLIDLLTELKNEYDIDLLPGNENNVKWKTNKEGGYISFPSGAAISFGGYTVASSVMGATAQGAPIFMTWTDEFVDPNEKEPLTDEELINTYDRLETSVLKNKSQKRSYDVIKEFSWKYFDKCLNKEVTRYFHKSPFCSFSFNPYDRHHIFYKIYAQNFLPLDDRNKALLKEKDCLWYEDQEQFNGLGLFIYRMTMGMTWELLDNVMKKKILKTKESNPAEFECIYYGFDYTSGVSAKFPFRTAFKNLKQYDIKNFYDKEEEMYDFDYYTVGIDWATGPLDKTVWILIGYKYNNSNKLYDPYIIEEIVISPNDGLSETDKTDYYCEQIFTWFQNLKNFEKCTFYYDDKSRSSIQHIEKLLFEKYALPISIITAAKHTTKFNQEAGLIKRLIWLKFIFEHGFIFGNTDQLIELSECMDELMFDAKRTNIPDQKMYQDPYDALFYGLYPERYNIPSNNTIDNV